MPVIPFVPSDSPTPISSLLRLSAHHLALAASASQPLKSGTLSLHLSIPVPVLIPSIVTSRPTTASRPSNPLNPSPLAPQIRLCWPLCASINYIYLLILSQWSSAAVCVQHFGEFHRRRWWHRRSDGPLSTTAVPAVQLLCSGFTHRHVPDRARGRLPRWRVPSADLSWLLQHLPPGTHFCPALSFCTHVCWFVIYNFIAGPNVQNITIYRNIILSLS